MTIFVRILELRHVPGMGIVVRLDPEPWPELVDDVLGELGL